VEGRVLRRREMGEEDDEKKPKLEDGQINLKVKDQVR
jgi:hypothetical protein